MLTLEKYNENHINDWIEFVKEFQQYGDEFNQMGVVKTVVEIAGINKNYEDLDREELRNIFPKYLEFTKNMENFITLPKKDWVESDFFAICKYGKMIGEIIFRKRLNAFLLLNSLGHIAFKIKHSERGKGFGSQALKLMLNNIWDRGYTEVSVSCKENNIASAKIIEKNGGIFNRINDIKKESIKREYWFFRPINI